MINLSESKHERFKRVAESRTNKVLKLMELLGNCANKNNYEYTDVEAEKIISVLDVELYNLKQKFKQPHKKEKESFTLDK